MNEQHSHDTETVKHAWHRPELVVLGKFAELVQQGGGKISILTGDPGEPRKVPSTG